ncbi:MAG: hypothetical protein GC136_05330 [Alphaproteobacteria bacterium]|nr:hypothetical protein [Alphaproteobacteria bacterium]
MAGKSFKRPTMSAGVRADLSNSARPHFVGDAGVESDRAYRTKDDESPPRAMNDRADIPAAPRSGRKSRIATRGKARAMGIWSDLFNPGRDYPLFDALHLWGVRTVLLDMPFTVLTGIRPRAIRDWARAHNSPLGHLALQAVRALPLPWKYFSKDFKVDLKDSKKRTGFLTGAFLAASVAAAATVNPHDHIAPLPFADSLGEWTQLDGSVMETNIAPALELGGDIMAVGRSPLAVFNSQAVESAHLLRNGGEITVNSVTVDDKSDLFEPLVRMGQGAEIMLEADAAVPRIFTAENPIEFSLEDLERVQEIGNIALIRQYQAAATVRSFDAAIYERLQAGGQMSMLDPRQTMAQFYMQRAIETNPNAFVSLDTITWSQLQSLLDQYYPEGSRNRIQAETIAAMYRAAAYAQSAAGGGIAFDQDTILRRLAKLNKESGIGVLERSPRGALGPYQFTQDAWVTAFNRNRQGAINYARDVLQDQRIVDILSASHVGTDRRGLAYRGTERDAFMALRTHRGLSALLNIYNIEVGRDIARGAGFTEAQIDRGEYFIHNGGPGTFASLTRQFARDPRVSVASVVASGIREENESVYVGTVGRTFALRQAEDAAMADQAMECASALLGPALSERRISLATLRSAGQENVAQCGDPILLKFR